MILCATLSIKPALVRFLTCNIMRYYIQSAFALPDQEKMDQEQASLIKISDSFKKIIVVNSNTPVWRNDQGILVMNLYDFLLNEDSLDM